MKANTQPRIIQIFFFGLCILFASGTSATDHPDDLYRKGRFAEAEEAYAQLDMTHPREPRYRFNRGCAAYQKGDFQGAMAAFSSVLRRSQSKDLRFSAAYNLGNTAYQLGDYNSAATFFKQALSEDPTREDAQYNLELTLRALEKQKKEEEKQQENPQGKDQEQKKGDSEGDKTPEAEKDEGRDQQENNQESRENDGEKSEQKEASQDSESHRSEGKTQEDLTGELRPRQDVKGQTQDGEREEEPQEAIDRMKAEALLDNIKEDRTRYLRSLMPEEKRQGSGSGKDW